MFSLDSMNRARTWRAEVPTNTLDNPSPPRIIEGKRCPGCKRRNTVEVVYGSVSHAGKTWARAVYTCCCCGWMEEEGADVINLTNKWMNSPTYLAAVAHFFAAYAVVLTAFLLWRLPGALVTAGVGLGAAAVQRILVRRALRDPEADGIRQLAGLRDVYARRGGAAVAVVWIKAAT